MKTNMIRNDKINDYRVLKEAIIEKFNLLSTARKQFKTNEEIRRDKSTTIAFLEFKLANHQR